MSGYNPSTPTALGLEWMVDEDPSTYVLDSPTRAYALHLPNGGGVSTASIGAYAAAASGAGVYGCEIYSGELIPNASPTSDIDYPGTDTGDDVSSVLNGGAAWVTNAGATATFAAIDPGDPAGTYLKNVNGAENPACWCMFSGNSPSQMAGKRVVSVEVHVNAGGTMIGTPMLIGYLRLSGANYVGNAAAIAQYNGWNDYNLGTFLVNPSTSRPWRLNDINNLVSAIGNDLFGCRGLWEGQSAGSLQIISIYLLVKWVPEDRLGYAYGSASASGWKTWTAYSTPNLLTTQDSNFDLSTANTGQWVAGANTSLSNVATNRGAPWTRSMRLTSAASGAMSATSQSYVCIPGKEYSAACFSNVTSGRSTSIAISFYDANGTLLVTTTGGSLVGTGAFQAGMKVGPVVAPASAATMKLTINMTATAVSQVANVEGVFLSLADIAILSVYDTATGGASPVKIDGATEQTGYMIHATDQEQVVFHKLSGTGTISLPTFPAGSSAVGMPLGFTSSRPTLKDSSGAVLAVSDDEQTDSVPVVFVAVHNVEATNGPQTLSQVYAKRITGQVDTSNTVKQEVTTPVGTYGLVRLVCSGTVDPPAAPLLIKLKKVSDNSQVGGTATIQPTDLAQLIPRGGTIASRTTPQVILVKLASNAVTTAIQHYLEFSSVAASGQGWFVYALDDLGFSGDSVLTDTITQGGTTDAYTDPLTGGRNTRRDAMATLLTVPTTPGSFAALAVGP